MCGIALAVGPNPSVTVFDQMLDAIAPRGDVREALRDDRHYLGTQRLKIVDRERAIQPWNSPDGRWAVCYNGEVYNFRALRSELADLGHQLRSDSDTEVILEAFAAGVPVVAFASGGIPEMVEQGATGFLVEERSPKALAFAMLDALESPGRRREVADRARAKARTEFSLERYRAQMIEVVEAAMT